RVEQARPAGAGGDYDMGSLELEDVRGGELVAPIEIHVREPLELPAPPLKHPSPGRKSRQTRLEAQAATGLIRRLRDRHLVAAAAERQCTLEPRGTATDNEHGRRARCGRNTLGMPAAAPFLACRWILRTADRHAIVPTRDADVAADALADVLLAAGLDLHRKEGIRDRRARRADEIEHAAPDLTDHGVGGGEAADPDHGLARDFLDEVD